MDSVVLLLQVRRDKAFNRLSSFIATDTNFSFATFLGMFIKSNVLLLFTVKSLWNQSLKILRN